MAIICKSVIVEFWITFFPAAEFNNSVITSTLSPLRHLSNIHSHIIRRKTKFNALHKPKETMLWPWGQNYRSRIHIQFNAERHFPIPIYMKFENTNNSPIPNRIHENTLE